MENTRFLSAIEEQNTLSETKSDEATEPEVENVVEKDSKQQNSDLIDLDEDFTEKPRKPRSVDQFFANQSRGCLLSPIKPSITERTDLTQDSLDLKLDRTYTLSTNYNYAASCVQPNDSSICSTNILDENIIVPAVEEETEPKSRSPQDRSPENSSHTRKRLPEEMEPAVFDVPRATKHLHREESAIPEFQENSAPVIKFTSETDELFKPKVENDVKNEGKIDVKNNNESNSQKDSSSTEPAHDNCCSAVERHNEVAAPERLITYGYEYTPNQGFNITVDMTLRTSGGMSFASGLFLAIDEALDPLIGAIVPYGRRQRGLNIALVCVPIVIAMYYLFFSS